MNTDPSALMWGVLFGGIGMGYFVYGKKQKNPVALFAGIALFLIPYFITDNMWLVVASVMVMILPFFYKI